MRVSLATFSAVQNAIIHVIFSGVLHLFVPAAALWFGFWVARNYEILTRASTLINKLRLGAVRAGAVELFRLVVFVLPSTARCADSVSVQRPSNLIIASSAIGHRTELD
jgi:hypothetical protein